MHVASFIERGGAKYLNMDSLAVDPINHKQYTGGCSSSSTSANRWALTKMSESVHVSTL